MNFIFISSQFPYKFERQRRNFLTSSYGSTYVETFDTSMISKMNHFTRESTEFFFMSDIYYEN